MISLTDGFYHSSLSSSKFTVAKKLGFSIKEPEGLANITMLPLVPPSKSPVTIYLPAAMRSFFLSKLHINEQSI